MTIKLLGPCPRCNLEDGISQLMRETKYKSSGFGTVRQGAYSDKVQCKGCGTRWNSDSELIKEGKELGDSLISVNVHRMGNMGVVLDWPEKRDIPWANTIVGLLNTALMQKFGINACFAVEGGVEGMYGKNYVSFTNYHSKIGLSVECSWPAIISVSQSHKPILNFYEKMFRLLFEAKFSDKYRRGEILRLDSKQNGAYSKFMSVIYDVMSVAESKDFASLVFARAEKMAREPFGSYVRGLTDEEIVESFVPPPIK